MFKLIMIVAALVILHLYLLIINGVHSSFRNNSVKVNLIANEILINKELNLVQNKVNKPTLIGCEFIRSTFDDYETTYIFTPINLIIRDIIQTWDAWGKLIHVNGIELSVPSVSHKRNLRNKCIVLSSDTEIFINSDVVRYSLINNYKILKFRHNKVDNFTSHWFKLKSIKEANCDYIIFLDNDVSPVNMMDLSSFHNDGLLVGSESISGGKHYYCSGVFSMFKEVKDDFVKEWYNCFKRDVTHWKTHPYDQVCFNDIINKFNHTTLTPGMLATLPGILMDHRWSAFRYQKTNKIQIDYLVCSTGYGFNVTIKFMNKI